MVKTSNNIEIPLKILSLHANGEPPTENGYLDNHIVNTNSRKQSIS